MARYIDIKGAGIGKANREQFLVPEFADGWNAVLKILEKEPTADVVEVKHGEWVEWYPPKEYILTGEEMLYYCTNCDAKYSDVEGYKYCPYCGAKMDGGKAE